MLWFWLVSFRRCQMRKMIVLDMKHFPLLLCVLQGYVSADGIIATVGTDVTLFCNYDAQHYGKLSVCWGRGAIPNRGCANEVIKSDGTSVISRESERHLLMGDLAQGDVSLTIRQVEEGDSGTYGCRVEIPGWFNDHKHQMSLTVVAVRPNPLKVEMRQVTERSVVVRWTLAFDGGRPITSYRVDLKNKQASWDTAVRTEVSDPALTQVTLVDLRPAKSYNLRMFATNMVGTSDASNVLTITTKEAAPEGRPLDPQLEALSSHSIKVTWKPPRPDLRNGMLRGYDVSYKEVNPSEEISRWERRNVMALSESMSIVIDNLKPATEYVVLIQAKTNAGVGPSTVAPFCTTLDEVLTTAASDTVPPTSTGATSQKQDATTVKSVTDATVWDQTTRDVTAVPPAPPVVVLKGVSGNLISILWTPGFQGDSPITGYYLEYKAANASWQYTESVVSFGPNQTEATIMEMNPSTYNIRMFAKSSVGSSNASNVLTFTTGTTDAGQQEADPVATVTSDTISPDAAAIVNESHNGHLAAIVMPVVLLVLVVAIVTTWQIRRIKQKQGGFSMWVANGALRYRGAESLQEL